MNSDQIGKVWLVWKYMPSLHQKVSFFSAAGTQFASTVNSNVSVFDAAIPGTLPVLNKKCVELAVMSSLALSCKINRISLFDRKHYFYSDLPAGYQITQQRKPIALNGFLDFYVYTPGIHKTPYIKSSKIKQIQLEQDSGKSLHDETAKISLVDLNRAGVPLIELVFEPDLSDGEEAASLVKELSQILYRIGSCSCKMEEGALRVDANVSIHKEGTPFGTRTEIKNIGSIRGVANAVNYEIKRQKTVLEKGETILNETRFWDAATKKTIAMRDKEEMQDYRYMPEPNLPPLRLIIDNEDCHYLGHEHVLDVRNWQEKIPELPEQSRKKLINDYGFSQLHAVTLVNQPKLFEYFCQISSEKISRNGRTIYDVLMIELLGALKSINVDVEECTLKPSCLGECVDLIQDEKINVQICRRIIDRKLGGDKRSPHEMVEQENWYQIKDPEEVEKLCRKVMEKLQKHVKSYQKGKTKVFKNFLFEINKTSEERVNIKIASKIMNKLLEENK